MRILIYSSAFFPSVGGLELMAKLLGEELTALGCHVILVTKTPDPLTIKYPFVVVRSPAAASLLLLYRESDVILHMNVSLKGLWPFLFVRRPFIISHQGPYRRASGYLGIRERLKYFVARFATNIACSRAVKIDLPTSAEVIWNGYDDNLFELLSVDRPNDLVFVGRLVSEKGVDLLLRSLVALRTEGFRPSLCIVGYGPEELPLRTYCQENGLHEQVNFEGKLTGVDLAARINKSRIMVIPSRSEGFGIVALEGIACGCVVVASDIGGLPEAIGECGIIFRSGDVTDLSRQLIRALTDNALLKQCSAARDRHLARFSRRAVARRYFEIIKGAVARAGQV